MMSNTIDKVLFNIFSLMLMILAVFRGGEIEWQFLLFAVAVFSTYTIVALEHSNTELNKTNLFSSKEKTLRVAMLSYLLFVLYTLFQLFEITVSYNNTLIELIKYISYACVFLLTLSLVSNKRDILKLVNRIFLVSSLISIYSLLNYYTKGGFNLIDSIPPWTISWERAAHGTFSYQNHYAAFINITLPLGLGLSYFYHTKHSGNNNSTSKLGAIILFIGSKAGLYFMACLVMYLALLTTSSRGGNSVFIVAMSITFLVVLLTSSKGNLEKKKQKLPHLILFVIFTGLVLFMSGVGDKLTKRFENQGVSANGRDFMQTTAFAIIDDYPIFGSGAGTYPVIQHKYKPKELGNNAMSKRAHNDYLEMLSSQGVIGFSLLGFSTLLVMILLFRPLINSYSKLYGLQVACFCSTISILIHSLVDFNFQLPVLTVYFFTIAAIGIKIEEYG